MEALKDRCATNAVSPETLPLEMLADLLRAEDSINR
jgi:hypothetical protein